MVLLSGGDTYRTSVVQLKPILTKKTKPLYSILRRLCTAEGDGDRLSRVLMRSTSIVPFFFLGCGSSSRSSSYRHIYRRFRINADNFVVLSTYYNLKGKLSTTLDGPFSRCTW